MHLSSVPIIQSNSHVWAEVKLLRGWQDISATIILLSSAYYFNLIIAANHRYLRKSVPLWEGLICREREAFYLRGGKSYIFWLCTEYGSSWINNFAVLKPGKMSSMIHDKFGENHVTFNIDVVFQCIIITTFIVQDSTTGKKSQFLARKNVWCVPCNFVWSVVMHHVSDGKCMKQLCASNKQKHLDLWVNWTLLPLGRRK